MTCKPVKLNFQNAKPVFFFSLSLSLSLCLSLSFSLCLSPSLPRAVATHPEAELRAPERGKMRSGEFMAFGRAL